LTICNILHFPPFSAFTLVTPQGCRKGLLYKELALGFAYRPVAFDRVNMIGKYTFLEDESPISQSDFKDISQKRAHVLSLEAIYDLTDKWQIVEKGAYKNQSEKSSGFDFTDTQTWLLVNRLNYNFTKDWQFGAEYRALGVVQAEDLKQGALIEVSRLISDSMKLSAGFNFTDFSDDLTGYDYMVYGPFIRVTSTFYDKTHRETERAVKK